MIAAAAVLILIVAFTADHSVLKVLATVLGLRSRTTAASQARGPDPLEYEIR